MKTLLLLRHAKSSWADADQADFDRPLNERGQKAAPLIGRFMRKQKLHPDLILSSPAERARQTAALVIKAASLDSVELRYDARIYEASAARLLEIIAQIEERASEVLLVGHNTGMEDFVRQLTGESRRMPTAALAHITLDIEKWSKAREGTGTLDWLVKPKKLSDG
ncbi:MAG: histidine phosphatase family protein [Pyrinomonadaceae bacterium]